MRYLIDTKKILLFLIAAMIVLLVTPALAGPRAEAEATTGDTTVKDSSLGLGLASSLGDVDINECIVSKQMSVLVVWSGQHYDYNLWCMARDADLVGKHTEAAAIRCSIKEIAKVFPADCTVRMNFGTPEPDKPDDDSTADTAEQQTEQDQQLEQYVIEAENKLAQTKELVDDQAVLIQRLLREDAERRRVAASYLEDDEDG